MTATTTPALKVVLLSENATAPTKGSALAAGYDLYSSQDTVLKAKGRGLVDTDISIAVPIGTYGRVASRSGLGMKQGQLRRELLPKACSSNILVV